MIKKPGNPSELEKDIDKVLADHKIGYPDILAKSFKELFEKYLERLGEEK